MRPEVQWSSISNQILLKTARQFSTATAIETDFHEGKTT